MIKLTKQEKKKIERYAQFYATKLIEMQCDFEKLQAEWAEIQAMLLGKMDGGAEEIEKMSVKRGWTIKDGCCEMEEQV